jgi:hypothetical protein
MRRDTKFEVRTLCLYFFVATAKLNSMASLRSLSSWLSSYAEYRWSHSVLLGAEEDVEGDIDTIAVIFFGDAVPGLNDVFNGVFHALGGLPLDRWSFAGVVIS